jgi:murein DD-endopeptidase MepM/ murein hydrolase activator NlpD
VRVTRVGTTVLAVLLAPMWIPGAAAGAGLAQSVVPPVDGELLRPFTAPATPYGPGHRGVDLAAQPDDPVRAALPGVVTFAGEVARRGWVTVDHGGGLETTYGALDPRALTAGERVEAGQLLGRLAAGAGHLDWGARLHGDYIDPLRLFGRWQPHLVRLPR